MPSPGPVLPGDPRRKCSCGRRHERLGTLCPMCIDQRLKSPNAFLVAGASGVVHELERLQRDIAAQRVPNITNALSMARKVLDLIEVNTREP